MDITRHRYGHHNISTRWYILSCPQNWAGCVNALMHCNSKVQYRIGSKLVHLVVCLAWTDDPLSSIQLQKNSEIYFIMKWVSFKKMHSPKTSFAEFWPFHSSPDAFKTASSTSTPNTAYIYIYNIDIDWRPRPGINPRLIGLRSQMVGEWPVTRARHTRP